MKSLNRRWAMPRAFGRAAGGWRITLSLSNTAISAILGLAVWSPPRGPQTPLGFRAAALSVCRILCAVKETLVSLQVARVNLK